MSQINAELIDFLQIVGKLGLRLQTLCSSDQSPDLVPILSFRNLTLVGITAFSAFQVHCNSGIAAWSQGKLWHVGLCLLKRPGD